MCCLLTLISLSFFTDPWDPDNKLRLREVVVTRDLEAFDVVDEAEAQHFAKEHGDNADVWRDAETGQWRVKLRRNARIFLPKSISFNRMTAGIMPHGMMEAVTRYGIPDDIEVSSDPTMVYTLLAAVEAIASAGVVDPYEFYRYIHVARLGNSIGGGMGGMDSSACPTNPAPSRVTCY